MDGTVSRMHYPALLIIVVLLVGLVAWSAPILPRPALSDEVLSLARLETAELIITGVPLSIHRTGVTARKIYEQWKSKLTVAGLKLSSGEGVPKLRVSTSSATDESMPDGVAFVIFVTLEQPVRVTRLEKELWLPTWTGLKVGLRSGDDVEKHYEAVMNLAIVQFLKRMREATAALR